MNVYSEKRAGKKSGKIGLNIAAQDCIPKSGGGNFPAAEIALTL